MGTSFSVCRKLRRGVTDPSGWRRWGRRGVGKDVHWANRADKPWLEEEVCPGAGGQDPSSASLGWEQLAVPGLCQWGPSLHLILNEATPIQVKCLKVSLKRFKVILGHAQNSGRVAGLWLGLHNKTCLKQNKTDKKQNLTSMLTVILTCCWINSFLYLPFLFN